MCSRYFVPTNRQASVDRWPLLVGGVVGDVVVVAYLGTTPLEKFPGRTGDDGCIKRPRLTQLKTGLFNAISV